MDDDAPVIVAMGNCVACGQLFSFNPARVPSVRASFDQTSRQWTPCATRQPLCATCWARFNARRIAQGLPAHDTLPGAYAPGPISDLDDP